jgi:Bacterial regulatory proteins, luxR family
VTIMRSLTRTGDRPRRARPTQGRSPGHLVLTLLAGDLSIREIAERLFLSQNTIRSHTRALYRKLDVHTRGGRDRPRHHARTARANPIIHVKDPRVGLTRDEPWDPRRHGRPQPVSAGLQVVRHAQAPRRGITHRRRGSFPRQCGGRADMTDQDQNNPLGSPEAGAAARRWGTPPTRAHRSQSPRGPMFLNCPRCRLSIEPRRPWLAIEHCPRCLACARLRVPLFSSPLPPSELYHEYVTPAARRSNDGGRDMAAGAPAAKRGARR